MFVETVLKTRRQSNQSYHWLRLSRRQEADMKPSLTIVRMFSVINCHHISVICHRSAHSEKITIKTQKQTIFCLCEACYMNSLNSIWMYFNAYILPICQCHNTIIVVGSLPFLFNQVTTTITIIIIISRWSS